MPLTKEQVLEALGAQPDLKTEIISSLKADFISAGPTLGLVVRSREEDQTFLDNHLQQVLPQKLEEKFSEKFKETLTELDNLVTQATGSKKGPHEKTSDYIKRALQELKDKAAQDPEAKARIKELETLLADKGKELEQKEKTYERELFQRDIDADYELGISDRAIAVPAHLKSDEDKQAYVATQKNLLRQGFRSHVEAKRDQEGGLVYWKDGKPLLGNDGKPMRASDILGSDFAHYFVPKGRQVNGTGAEGAGGGGGTFKTTDDVHRHLAAKGLEAGSKDYFTEFEKLTQEHKITVS